MMIGKYCTPWCIYRRYCCLSLPLLELGSLAEFTKILFHGQNYQ